MELLQVCCNECDIMIMIVAAGIAGAGLNFANINLFPGKRFKKYANRFKKSFSFFSITPLFFMLSALFAFIYVITCKIVIFLYSAIFFLLAIFFFILSLLLSIQYFLVIVMVAYHQSVLEDEFSPPYTRLNP